MSRNHPSNEQNHRQGYPSQPPGELAIHCSQASYPAGGTPTESL
jgi:hypothetical protein